MGRLTHGGLALAVLVLAGCVAPPVSTPEPVLPPPQPGIVAPRGEVQVVTIEVEVVPPKNEVAPFPEPEPEPETIVVIEQRQAPRRDVLVEPPAPEPRPEPRREAPAPLPAAPAPAPVPRASFSERAQAVANNYCGAPVVVDDPRLGGVRGKADWYSGTLLIASWTEDGRLRGVIAHECAHLVQYRVYGGNIDALAADMNAIYGGSGWSGLEQNADCVAAYWGAPNGYYTGNCSGARGDAAAQIAGGSRP